MTQNYMVQKLGSKLSASAVKEMKVNDAFMPILYCHLRRFSKFGKKRFSHMMFLKVALSIHLTKTKMTHMFFSSGYAVALVAANPERPITWLYSSPRLFKALCPVYCFGPQHYIFHSHHRQWFSAINLHCMPSTLPQMTHQLVNIVELWAADEL